MSRLKIISQRYEGRFSLVDSPDSYFGSKKITNHTKCTVIDYGRYFIQGGSGIKDNFANEGVLHHSKPIKLKNPEAIKIQFPKNITCQILQNKKAANDLGVKKTAPKALQSRDDNFIPKAPKLGKQVLKRNIGSKISSFEFNGSTFQIKPQFFKDESNYQRILKPKVKNTQFIDNFLPGAFRDQDFVFFSEGNCDTGKRVYQEALFLALKWDQHKKNGVLSSESWDLNKLNEKDEIFKKYPVLSPQDSLNNENQRSEIPKTALEKLLMEKIPDNIEDFEGKSNLTAEFTHKKANDVIVKTFFTGPEDVHSDWEDNLVSRIEKANNRIVIDQMYFQPSERGHESSY